ncbi:cupin [Leptolyngbya sp. Heron Island J]|uniref:cysteine dioxygenase family protein n=1 Tax=Leptolyngbya sp. Heron Island J TaxID=1385935 RepID=UPI0003B9F0EA|nr:cupin [Leptolyngbya sp. Heron Island J]ESA32416.1 cupin [Leptolyngbya sp. Heron Island J]
MEITDWLVTATGECQPRPAAKAWDLIRDRYYFHRFLTDITDLLDQAPHELEEWNFLPQIRMRVRQLFTNSYWLKTQQPDPTSKAGVSIFTLYDEIGYPLTVQNVLSMPGVVSPIHNHGTWGVTVIIKGQEKHTFWRSAGSQHQPFKIEPAAERVFGPGEIVSFMPETIHQVTTVGETPTLTFQLYGDTQPQARFEFQPEQATAKAF